MQLLNNTKVNLIAQNVAFLQRFSKNVHHQSVFRKIRLKDKELSNTYQTRGKTELRVDLRENMTTA